jgi:hypothetical protein
LPIQRSRRFPVPSWTITSLSSGRFIPGPPSLSISIDGFDAKVAHKVSDIIPIINKLSKLGNAWCCQKEADNARLLRRGNVGHLRSQPTSEAVSAAMPPLQRCCIQSLEDPVSLRRYLHQPRLRSCSVCLLRPIMGAVTNCEHSRSDCTTGRHVDVKVYRQ